MKPTLLLTAILLLLCSCKPKNGDTTEERLRQQNFSLKKENDSLKSVIEKLTRDYSGDTVQIAPEMPASSTYPTFPGRHALTLQWISWDKPGSVMIKQHTDGWYTVEGGQNGENGNYLKIKGRIRPINDRELEFEGTIESSIDHINGGEPCIRTGTKYFKATGTRKYWRLQDMINCVGGNVTDYVDIYF